MFSSRVFAVTIATRITQMLPLKTTLSAIAIFISMAVTFAHASTFAFPTATSTYITSDAPVSDQTGSFFASGNKVSDVYVNACDGSVRSCDGSVRICDGSVRTCDGSVRQVDLTLTLARNSLLHTLGFVVSLNDFEIGRLSLDSNTPVGTPLAFIFSGFDIAGRDLDRQHYLFALTVESPVGRDEGSVSFSYGVPGSLILQDPLETPIPAALPLFATGLGAMGLMTWRRKRKAVAA